MFDGNVQFFSHHFGSAQWLLFFLLRQAWHPRQDFTRLEAKKSNILYTDTKKHVIIDNYQVMQSRTWGQNEVCRILLSGLGKSQAFIKFLGFLGCLKMLGWTWLIKWTLGVSWGFAFWDGRIEKNILKPPNFESTYSNVVPMVV